MALRILHHLDNPDGTVKSVRDADDLINPTALEYVYAGNPARLAEVRDPLSGLVTRLSYTGYTFANMPACPAATPINGVTVARPFGTLCAVTYWDNTQTVLEYFAASAGAPAGLLRAVINPANETTVLSYDTAGRVNGVMTPFAYDQLTAQVGLWAVAQADISKAYTRISFDGAGKIQRVTMPATDTANGEPYRDYSYTASAGVVSGVVNAAGGTGTILTTQFDNYGRIVSATNATGLTSTQAWDGGAADLGFDRVVTSTDPGGRTSQVFFDNLGRVTASYGPAPTGCFAVTRVPTCANVPSTLSEYDEYPQKYGLFATYWNDTANPQGGFDNRHHRGAPLRAGMLAYVPSTFLMDWGAAAPTGITADRFSSRITGNIKIPSNGTWSFRGAVNTGDGVKVWIDDQIVLENPLSSPPTPNLPLPNGTFSNSDGDSWHKIRIDYFHATGNASLQLFWTPPGGAEAVVPNSQFAPGFDHTSKTTVVDGTTGSPATMTAANFGAPTHLPTNYTNSPFLHLPVSQTIDPAGLALTTNYEYSDTYYRMTKKIQPAGNFWTYTYWGNTAAGVDSCSGGVSQMGRLKSKTHGANGSTPVVDEFEYDLVGRSVMSLQSSGGAGAKNKGCSTFDQRGRPTSVATSNTGVAGTRTEQFFYVRQGTANNVLGSYSTQLLNGAVVGTNQTVQTDWAGRDTRYTDWWNSESLTAYGKDARVSNVVRGNNLGWAKHTLGFSYLNDGRLNATTYSPVLGTAKTLETVNYQTDGDLASVAYGNATTLTPTYDSLDRDTKHTITKNAGGTVIASNEVTLSQSGRIVDEKFDGVDANATAGNYVYDGVGRLTKAFAATGTTFDYEFSGSHSCGTTTAGKNSNRTRVLVNGAVRDTFCYDDRDRLISRNESAGVLHHVMIDPEEDFYGFAEAVFAGVS